MKEKCENLLPELCVAAEYVAFNYMKVSLWLEETFNILTSALIYLCANK